MAQRTVSGKNALRSNVAEVDRQTPHSLHSRLEAIRSLVRQLSLRTKFLLCVWLVFLVLVAVGIHGSSIALAIEQWSPGSRYAGYLIPKLAGRLPGLDPDTLRGSALSKSQPIRTDEWLRNTPLVLSQLNQNPRFPVINTGVGDGENMLLYQLAPVWHIATLARPATWGFFILGAQRGLAWEWWFPTFGCFTALMLLLEVVLRGQRSIAAFGAFWFCVSAYNVCWSLWPAWVVFFGALCCLSLYHLLTSRSTRIILISSILAGISIPGAIMIIYPPWLITTGYLFLLILIGLLVRDRIARARSERALDFEDASTESPGMPTGYLCGRRFLHCRLDRLIGIGLFVALAGGLIFSFLWTCWPSLKVIAGTVYPGHRRSAGGDYGLTDYFKGFYNFYTNYNLAGALGNQSEAASFFYLFPAVIAGLVMSSGLRRALGLVGWLALIYVIALSVYSLAGWPQRIADVTLMSYAPGYRVDIAIGLASIILCVIALAHGRRVATISPVLAEPTKNLVAAAAVAPLFLAATIGLGNRIFGIPSGRVIIISTAIGLVGYASIACYFMLSGEVRAFCIVVAIGLIGTSALFNPLATSLDQLYNSDLARQIVRLDEASESRPLWVCYGPGDTGILVTLLGGRTISGIQFPPQIGLWRDFDPQREFDEQYNRDAWVNLTYQDGQRPVSFANPSPHNLDINVAPDHPALLARGARYVLATGYAQDQIDRSRFPVVYQSPARAFTVFSIGRTGGR